MARPRAALRCLQGAILVVFAYLCTGELLPFPALKAGRQHLLRDWAVQQVVLLATLSCLTVLAASCRGGSAADPRRTAAATLLGINGVPLLCTLAVTHWFAMSDNCPISPEQACDYVAIVLDTVGLVSARLSRLDLGVCLLLAARGESAWLLGASSGWLGYAESIPLHRTAGWLCAAQSALHSVCYVLFYVATGGLTSLWPKILPTASADGKLNRLGLVNFLGVLAFLLAAPLAVPAWPPLRRRAYR